MNHNALGPHFLLSLHVPFSLLPRPAVFLVMGPFKTFFDVHTNNIIFKYIYTHSFMCAAYFWFSYCHFFQNRKRKYAYTYMFYNLFKGNNIP